MPVSKARTGVQSRTVPEFGLRRILELLHKAVDKIGVSRRKSGNRQTIQEFCFAEFLRFLPLQRETQCLWQNLVAKVLWHIKSRCLPKAVSQSLRIQLTLNSETACRVPRRQPAYYPRILLCRILELLCLCREKRSFFDKA